MIEDAKEFSVIFNNVVKKFVIRNSEKSLFGKLSSLRNGSTNQSDIRVLKVLDGLSFQVKKGEMFGIIGQNGAGKSTLLRLIANTIRPDSGYIRTYGNLIPMLELGTGFDENMSARENIVNYGIILGFKSKEIKEKVPEIIKFAELEDFASSKIRTFSSGMLARLAFATAAQVEPDILLIDEILSVGDLSFQQKSYKSFLKFKEDKKTIVFVTHNLSVLKKLCDRALLLRNGKAEIIGDPNSVTEAYIRLFSQGQLADQYQSQQINSIEDQSDSDSRLEGEDSGPISIHEVSKLVNTHQFSKAIRHLRKLLPTDPENGRLNYLYGFCLHHSKMDYKSALHHYNVALNNGFDEFWVRYARGSLFYILADYDLAREDLDKATSLKPGHQGARLILEQILSSESRFNVT